MNPKSFEETLQQTPFRPFDIHADGRVISVHHPEQVFITPLRTTVIVAMADDSIRMVDMDHISSLTVRSRRRKSSAPSHT
jgi:hypothetical protein